MLSLLSGPFFIKQSHKYKNLKEISLTATSSTSLQNDDEEYGKMNNHVSSAALSPSENWNLINQLHKNVSFSNPVRGRLIKKRQAQVGIHRHVTIPEISDICVSLKRQTFSQMSACPGCSTSAFYRPEPRRSPTAGRHTRPSVTDVCCCSGSL